MEIEKKQNLPTYLKINDHLIRATQAKTYKESRNRRDDFYKLLACLSTSTYPQTLRFVSQTFPGLTCHVNLAAIGELSHLFGLHERTILNVTEFKRKARALQLFLDGYVSFDASICSTNSIDLYAKEIREATRLLSDTLSPFPGLLAELRSINIQFLFLPLQKSYTFCSVIVPETNVKESVTQYTAIIGDNSDVNAIKNSILFCLADLCERRKTWLSYSARALISENTEKFPILPGISMYTALDTSFKTVEGKSEHYARTRSLYIALSEITNHTGIPSTCTSKVQSFATISAELQQGGFRR